MKHLLITLTVLCAFTHAAVAQKTDRDPKKDVRYEIIDNCDDDKADVYMVVIDSTCYVSNKEDINGPIRQSKIIPATIKNFQIFKEGSMPEWKKFSAMIPKYTKRLSSISIVIFKESRQAGK